MLASMHLPMSMEADLSSFQVYSSGVDYGVFAVECNTEVGSVHDKCFTSPCWMKFERRVLSWLRHRKWHRLLAGDIKSWSRTWSEHCEALQDSCVRRGCGRMRLSSGRPSCSSRQPMRPTLGDRFRELVGGSGLLEFTLNQRRRPSEGVWCCSHRRRLAVRQTRITIPPSV